MTKRSGGLWPARIDKEWPHQDALPDDLCVDQNFTLIRRFLDERGLSMPDRVVMAIWEDGKQEQWRLHCFANGAAAATFLDHFGGVVFDPKRDRENGRARGVWRRQGA